MEELLEVRDRLLGVVTLVVTTLFIGTAGYVLIERWRVFDALYMTVITLATVGYGETNPLSHAGRAFTIALIMGGIGVMTYAFSTITSIVVEGHLSTALRRRRMQREIDKLSGHYVVCGGGHAGGVIAIELKRTGRTCVVIDTDAESLVRLVERAGDGPGIHTIAGDATEDEVLKRAGVERAAGVFAVLGKDQDNAFVALSAKGLNPKIRVVCRQNELGVREKLFRSGADNVVNPEYIGGMRMASEMIRPATTGFLDSMLRERGSVARFDEISVHERSSFVGRPVGDLKTSQGKALLVAILEPGATKYELNPEPARAIKAGEKLVMLGEISHLDELRRKVETPA